jgi:hypothetical protein
MLLAVMADCLLFGNSEFLAYIVDQYINPTITQDL